jgi:hypothetical protein
LIIYACIYIDLRENKGGGGRRKTKNCDPSGQRVLAAQVLHSGDGRRLQPTRGAVPARRAAGRLQPAGSPAVPAWRAAITGRHAAQQAVNWRAARLFRPCLGPIEGGVLFEKARTPRVG